MTKELAKTLTTALVQFIDRETEGTMDCSSYECEKIEKAFEGGTYDVVENLIKKKPLVAWDRGQRLEFPSLTEAAEYYNTNISSISCAIKRGTGWKRVLFEYVDHITSPVLPQEPEKDSLVVTIKDKTYYSVKAPDKTNCEDCDIFKDKKPVSMIDVPMCYSYSLNNHKIVDYCRSKRIIWKRAR